MLDFSQGDIPHISAMGGEEIHEAGLLQRTRKGGHFAAFEQPETFVREVRTWFRQIRQGTR